MTHKRTTQILLLAGAALGIMLAGLLWFYGAPQRGEQTAGAPGPVVRPRVPRTPALPLPEGVSHTDDPVGGLRLEGLVTDARELPVGQATVAIDSHPPRHVLTEEDGSFFFDGLAGRVYRIMARKEGNSAGPVSWRLTQTSEPVMLKLEPGGGLEVTVGALLDSSPIRGATVQLRTLMPLTAPTDARGVATLTGLGPGRYHVTAHAAGYAPAVQQVYVAPAPDVTRLTLLLARGAPLSGKVVDEAGTPVKGARVEANMEAYHPTGAAVTTGEAGTFTIPALAAGTYNLAVAHPEMAPVMSRPITLDGLAPRSGVVITLKAGGEITGTVLLAGGGGAGGAVVHLAAHKYWLGRGVPRKQVVCDDGGKFHTRGLMRAELSLVAVHPLATSSEVRVDLVRARKAQLTITLDRDQSISGVVVDPSGQPVAQAQVTGESTRRKMSAVLYKAQARAFTDMGGQFELHGLKAGGYRLYAHMPGQSHYYSGSTKVVQSGARDVRLVFAGTGGVKGRVRFADGCAPKLFWVDPSHGEQVAFRGGQGEFLLPKLPAREQRLRILGPDFKVTHVGGVNIEPGKVLDLGTITVKGGRTVSGEVVDSRGVPVARALVLLDHRVYHRGDWITSFTDGVNPWDKQARTDASGTFAFRGVDADSMLIAAEHPRLGRSPFQRVPAGTEDTAVTLTLYDVSSLEGTVTRQGAPVVADITLSPADKAKGKEVRLYQTSGADGAYRFARLVPGRYQVFARRKTMFNQRVRERVLWTEVSPRGSRLDIELPTGASLEVSLLRKEETMASINLCPGVVQVQTMAELSRREKAKGKACPSAFLTSGSTLAAFHDVEPGKYSVCAWLIFKRVGDPLPKPPGAKIPRDMFCQEVQVASAPQVQALTMNLK